MIYKRLFQEKAMSVSDAVKNKYCLLITKGNDSRIYFILYDSKIIKFEDKEMNIDSIYKSIISMIKISKSESGGFIPSSAYMIVESVALPNSGAGVLMYDIVMSWLKSKNKGLVPDRTSVSKSAQKVWKYYFDNRGDVEKIKIDDIQDDDYPLTKDKSDDGDINNNLKHDDYKNRNFLNHIYMIKKSLDYSKLTINNNKFFIFAKKFINVKSIKQNLIDGGNWLFIKLY